MVLGDRRKWNESTKGKAWSGSKLGRAGDGARELLPWTACPGTQKNLDPEHPLAREGLQGQTPCAPFISLFNTGCVVSCSRTMCLAPTYCRSPAVPLACLLAMNGFECRGKRSKVHLVEKLPLLNLMLRQKSGSKLMWAQSQGRSQQPTGSPWASSFSIALPRALGRTRTHARTHTHTHTYTYTHTSMACRCAQSA